MKRDLKSARRFLIATVALCACELSAAASGEMGGGIPNFGLYSAATGTHARVWGLASPTLGFPAGCDVILLTPETMGIDAYKLAVATMTVAKLSRKVVRFYAHAERDGGCGVDYVQLLD